ncbi:Protein SPA1-related 4 [Vitis vinifera]|uniref:Protein SPA1-related 4 n=1 Tax=Vitis vinifera TaxID=29760 RepID=A0A438H507_VITVI|nr:Protein SPA1-related 4 [Vitis vinifera]
MEEREAAIELRERIEEQELLLEFLLLMQQRKQGAVDKLQDTISFLSSDIEEVENSKLLLGKGEAHTKNWSRMINQHLIFLQWMLMKMRIPLVSAGVNKKIKVFECNSILNEDRDIHYPVVEMACRSKLSSICWNSYIKSQIASSNFEGVVQVWDVTRSQVLTEMREHERRVWSIDYSLADPTMLASGSDDGSVKLWSINQAILFLHLVDGVSVGTIKTKANVCCVQFTPDSGRYLAFGSADHRIYYYDLRNSKIPLCTLLGHNKTVSYVKFVDSTHLVSASTDNTLKLWDLSMCTARNFVGLSVSDGYIATGSEANEVVIYHKAFPMPALTFKFNSMDSDHESDDSAQFISSVCWRGQSSTLVAANSAGNIKILEMV